ncbi:MAG: energy transducer TonB [Bacteroidetes bacterium HGW-Bacteroidetes-15]|nr:MAG: energy transducer TonB [Bacteroidetes bacterium HGW-Bacteroidetes-15]
MKTKSKKADLEGKKFLFFQAGLIIALGLALAAFEWPTKGEVSFDYVLNTNPIETPDDVIITRPDEIKPPPPPPTAPMPEIIRIHDNETDLPDFDPTLFEQDSIVILPPPKTEEEDVDEIIPFMLIEEKPSFMGGDYNTFTQWVAKRIVYPELAAINGIQGRVTIQFLIDTDGSVKDIRVIQSVDKLLAEEALRVVSQSPSWSPGKQRGKPTKVIFTFPFTYRLQ